MRKTAFFFLLAVHVAAVGADDSQSNRILLAACMRYANEGQLDKYAECWSAEATNNGRLITRELIMTFMTDIRRTPPDYRSELIEQLAQGDTIVTLSRVTGTHRGVAQTSANGGLLQGAKATGKRFDVLQAHWWKLKDGKIIFHQGVRDDLGMMRQLGLIGDELPASLKAEPLMND